MKVSCSRRTICPFGQSRRRRRTEGSRGDRKAPRVPPEDESVPLKVSCPHYLAKRVVSRYHYATVGGLSGRPPAPAAPTPPPSGSPPHAELRTKKTKTAPFRAQVLRFSRNRPTDRPNGHNIAVRRTFIMHYALRKPAVSCGLSLYISPYKSVPRSE